MVIAVPSTFFGPPSRPLEVPRGYTLAAAS